MSTRRIAILAVPVAICVCALTAMILVILAGGFDLSVALVAFWRGSIGTPYALLSATLVRAAPLILIGVAVAIAFRAGVLNIGADGQLLIGATAATMVGLSGSAWPAALLLPAECLAGMAAGSAWAMIAAILKRRFGVLEVISTLMLNFIAAQVVSYLVHGPLQEPTHTYPQTLALESAARLPTLVPGHRLHLGLIVAIFVATATWWMLRATAAGFRIRTVGANPSAAESAGRVNVRNVVFGALVASGAMSGLGGATLVMGQTYALFENISSGLGYTAIAVALLARLNPVAVIATGLFFSALETGAAAMQRDAGVPSVFVLALEAIVVLGVLFADSFRNAQESVAAVQ